MSAKRSRMMDTDVAEDHDSSDDEVGMEIEDLKDQKVPMELKGLSIEEDDYFGIKVEKTFFFPSLVYKLNSATVAPNPAKFERYFGRCSERHNRSELHRSHHQTSRCSNGRSKRRRSSFEHFNHSAAQEPKMGARSWKTSYQKGRIAEGHQSSWSKKLLGRKK